METLELIFGILACIAFFVLDFGFGSSVFNKVTGRFELVGGWMEEVGCLTRLIIILVCVGIILIWLWLRGDL